MNFNPPPVIVLYKQSLNEINKKNYSKLWQQEPIQVKEFFSNLFQALKQAKDVQSQAIFELETSDSLSDISEINGRNQQFITESSNSIQELLNFIDIQTEPHQSAFLESNSLNQIAQLCTRMKQLNLDQELNTKLDQSYLDISKLIK